MKIGNSNGKQSPGYSGDNLSGMGYSRVNVVVGIACASSFVYVLSLFVMSVRPCLPSPCASFTLAAENITISESADIGNSLKGVSLIPHHPLDLKSGHSLPVGEGNSDAIRGTQLSRIVFGIAAATDMWWGRKEYLKLWWKPSKMRGYVFLDKKPYGNYWTSEFPPYKISENTSRFRYTYKRGWRSAIRISRIVSEMYRLGLPNVDWFVMGDDDTLFVADNLVQVLSKYDHTKMYYVGSNSESHLQNILFSYDMAFGGGGFAISYPLAKALAKMQDDCLSRYSYLFGSDDRMHACMAELGIPLTKEPGFHQLDIVGDISGLLAAHPVAPLVTLHHLEKLRPIFPNTATKNFTRVRALSHLLKAAEIEAASVAQQSICYDSRRKWSFSVSWGYVVQVLKGFITPRELEVAQRTFLSWHRESSKVEFPFNTRANPDDICKQPTRFFMDSVKGPAHDSQDLMEAVFVREFNGQMDCAEQLQPLSAVKRIRVMRKKTHELWYQTPRRSCCRIRKWKNENIDIHVGECEEGESLVSSF
ncbi:uncharacterized protein [Physcomitrium patens]|uniref:Uncharacterized protein n=1 Tax=Physcomitrium patens TaxID=3218 RepID=A0A2K1KQ49_PHYPA|nr:uncharacterized protein LOC112281168 isoform X1 [Physcomitrium patens]XP_024373174.1 uncharacterized protein LOC112281168 isoform X1 [Physcomitrium patens]XP_024373175.1 uncharacterized protein LOC112281168 isoform X1 [Physcomitrium patens]PNR55922.1 hypothetical protein PHYPA_006819 [Physcomitrium patens]|eukprot:XP_024373173.1 uncharacterized protein LOC112281168 isoform X1 [Physcomitrella patens]